MDSATPPYPVCFLIFAPAEKGDLGEKRFDRERYNYKSRDKTDRLHLTIEFLHQIQDAVMY